MTVHLGFCVPVDESNPPPGHQSSAWWDWDGGQVGGRPSWLDPEHLPDSPFVCCDTPMAFICQIYAPKEDDAHHRTLYVFACEHDSRIRVLRVQLPQDNPYWPFSEDDGDDVSDQDDKKEKKYHNLCAICNFPSKGKCPKTQRFFCGKEHQKIFHKHGTFGIFPMMEIVVEDEPPDAVADNDTKGKTPIDVVEEEVDSDAELEQDDLNAMTGCHNVNALSKEDEEAFEQFQARLQRPNARDQVLRYGGEPLWMRAAPSPLKIPNCPCGAPREFECQLMPQLLQYLMKPTTTTSNVANETIVTAISQANDIIQQAPPEQIPPSFVQHKDRAVKRIQQQLYTGLDWGVVAIYTCTAHCDEYHEEYAFAQPPIR